MVDLRSASTDTPFERVWGTIGVVGVGLIGGSLAASIRQMDSGCRIIGFAPDETAREALALGLVDELAGAIADLAAESDLIVLAAPVLQMPAVLREVAPAVRAHCVIMDCASTKQSVIAAARLALGSQFSRFVPAHPIAGSERYGPSAARVGLYKGARVILCPQPETDPDALAKVQTLWRQLGSRVSELDATEHDRLYAAVSHWPHAVAFALSGALAHSDLSEAALRAAGAGLKDTTRIAASSAALWAEILLDNRVEALRAAQEFQAQIDLLTEALRKGDRNALEQAFGIASRWRAQLEDPFASNGPT